MCLGLVISSRANKVFILRLSIRCLDPFSSRMQSWLCSLIAMDGESGVTGCDCHFSMQNKVSTLGVCPCLVLDERNHLHLHFRQPLLVEYFFDPPPAATWARISNSPPSSKLVAESSRQTLARPPIVQPCQQACTTQTLSIQAVARILAHREKVVPATALKTNAPMMVARPLKRPSGTMISHPKSTSV